MHLPLIGTIVLGGFDIGTESNKGGYPIPPQVRQE